MKLFKRFNPEPFHFKSVITSTGNNHFLELRFFELITSKVKPYDVFLINGRRYNRTILIHDYQNKFSSVEEAEDFLENWAQEFKEWAEFIAPRYKIRWHP